MKILSDAKGYLDRQCPNENCLFEFKISMQDWEDKVSDEEVHCPLCGQIAPSDSWYTYEQLDLSPLFRPKGFPIRANLGQNVLFRLFAKASLYMTLFYLRQ